MTRRIPIPSPISQSCSFIQPLLLPADLQGILGSRNGLVLTVGAAISDNLLLITMLYHRIFGQNGALAGRRGAIEMKSTRWS